MTDEELMLQHADASVRHDALLRLRSDRSGVAAAAIIPVLRGDPDDDVRAHAALVLGDCGVDVPEACELLLAILTDTASSANLRGHAAEGLNGFDDPRVTPALIEALRDPAPEVRYDAAFALSARRATEALPALEAAAAVEHSMFTDVRGSVRAELERAQRHIRGIDDPADWPSRPPAEDA